MISNTLDGLEGMTHDVCVVGAGPAGLTLALEMERLGKSVLVLESGGLVANQKQQSLSTADILDPDSHDDMQIAVSRRLGGTSNLWAGRCVPFDPIDFEPRPHVPEASWPIDLDDVSQHYQKASAYLSGGETNFVDLIPGISIDETEFSYTRLERYSNCPAIQVAHRQKLKQSQAIDIRLNSTLVDVVLDEKNEVTALEVARPDGEVHTIPTRTLVLACGGLETTRMLLAMQKKKAGLFGGEEGALGKYYMGHVTGEVADIVFTNKRFESAFGYYVDGDGNYVRRRFVPSDDLQSREALSNIAFWPVVPPISDADHQSGILSLLFLALATRLFGSLFIAEVIRKKHVPDGVDKIPHLLNVAKELPGATGYGISFLYKRYFSKSRIPGFFIPNRGHRYGLSYHAEQCPRRDSKVYLSDKLDRFGLPSLVIDLRFSQEDAVAVLRSHKLFSDWLAKHEIGRVEYRAPEELLIDEILAVASQGTHQIGTARMGTNRTTAVVDGNLRTFDVRNLFLLSSAVFPSSGQCNPTLTISALGVRLSQHLARHEY